MFDGHGDVMGITACWEPRRVKPFNCPVLCRGLASGLASFGDDVDDDGDDDSDNDIVRRLQWQAGRMPGVDVIMTSQAPAVARLKQTTLPWWWRLFGNLRPHPRARGVRLWLPLMSWSAWTTDSRTQIRTKIHACASVWLKTYRSGLTADYKSIKTPS